MRDVALLDTAFGVRHLKQVQDRLVILNLFGVLWCLFNHVTLAAQSLYPMQAYIPSNDPFIITKHFWWLVKVAGSIIEDHIIKSTMRRCEMLEVCFIATSSFAIENMQESVPNSTVMTEKLQPQATCVYLFLSLFAHPEQQSELMSLLIPRKRSWQPLNHNKVEHVESLQNQARQCVTFLFSGTLNIPSS